MSVRSFVAALALVAMIGVAGCEKRQRSFSGIRQGHAPRKHAPAWAFYQPAAVAQNGYSSSQQPTYLGKLSANRYDPDSTSNPYGRYGSQYSPDSVNNPYGRFGNPYSPQSATNPYATKPPRIILTGD